MHDPRPDPAHERPLLDHLRIARAAGVGPRTARLLREHLGSLAAALATPVDGLVARGVPARVARALHEPALEEGARAELAHARRKGDALLGLELPGYPPGLARIHDPPLVLAARGALRPEDELAVAVVGARRATPAALLFAHRLAHDLARAGVTVVSGLARGVDHAAHEGALAAGGRTLAVLGAGLDAPLAPPAAELAARVACAGAVLSEFAPRAPARKHTFPQRNRVIVGLSRGVVVVQAGARSGALITADLAQEEGREVFAVPGWPEEPLSCGPNGLLRDGAHVVEGVDDVLDVVVGVRPRDEDAGGGLSGGLAGGEAGDPPAGDAGLLWRALGPRPLALAELLAHSGLDWSAGLVALGRLEMEGRAVRRGPGYVRA